MVSPRCGDGRMRGPGGEGCGLPVPARLPPLPTGVAGVPLALELPVLPRSAPRRPPLPVPALPPTRPPPGTLLLAAPPLPALPATAPSPPSPPASPASGCSGSRCSEPGLLLLRPACQGRGAVSGASSKEFDDSPRSSIASNRLLGVLRRPTEDPRAPAGGRNLLGYTFGLQSKLYVPLWALYSKTRAGIQAFRESLKYSTKALASYSGGACGCALRIFEGGMFGLQSRS
mmetsp:Transcript_100659/g.324758  ORF Transcript_100659/g.324758 Transcript_100659/m.324758 type:complete len:230 (-) Transcript_100659:362-1051(-)